MSKYQFGETNREGRLLDHVTVDATSAAVDLATKGYNLARSDGSAYQLITENIDSGPIAIGASDSSVTASTMTFVLPGYDFTGQTGATIHIAGAANAGNDGAFVITSVTDAHTVVASAATGLVDETFDPATVTITVERTDVPLLGTWEIDVSNIFSINLGNDREVADPKWSDITPGFSPAIVAVTAASNQPAQAAPFAFRAHRVVFHATGGVGYVSVYNFQKGS